MVILMDEMVDSNGFENGSKSGFQWDFHGFMPSCSPSGKRSHNEEENHHLINGKSHYFD